MKVTSKQTFRVVKAMLELGRFKQYEISKKEGVTFSVVNRVVNWFVYQGLVAKRKGYYELVSPAGILNLFPLDRRMAPARAIDVELKPREVLEKLKDKGVLCLTSALPYYDNYFRDPSIHVYLEDHGLINEFRSARPGYTKIFTYDQDLPVNNAVKHGGQLVTDEVRTIIDLFCSNKSYAAERLVKRKWL